MTSNTATSNAVGTNTTTTTNVIAALVTVAAAAAVILMIRKNKKKKSSLKRSWSFTANTMRTGVFPSSVNAPATIINIGVYFEKEVPSDDEFIKNVIVKLLQYDDRFSMIPTDGGIRLPTKPYRAKDLLRTIVSKEEQETVIMKIIMNDEFEKDRELPWWEIVVLRGHKMCLLRFHHSIGDGLSLVKVFDGIIQTTSSNRVESKVTAALMKRKMVMPSIPSMLQSTWDVLTLGVSQHDATTRFHPKQTKFKYSGSRKIVFFPKVSLSYIKELKSKSDSSFNDILTYAISQMIYNYNTSTQPSNTNQYQCRALLPMSLPRSSSSTLTNHFSMVSADISACRSFKTRKERLQDIVQTTTKLKSSPTAYIQLWFQNNLLSKLPAFLGKQTAFDIFSRHSLVLTNVPGPETKCHLANHTFDRLELFFLNVVPQIDLLSYAGTLYGNIIYDPIELKEGDTLFPQLYAKALVDLSRELDVEPPEHLVKLAASYE